VSDRRPAHDKLWQSAHTTRMLIILMVAMPSGVALFELTGPTVDAHAIVREPWSNPSGVTWERPRQARLLSSDADRQTPM